MLGPQRRQTRTYRGFRTRITAVKTKYTNLLVVFTAYKKANGTNRAKKMSFTAIEAGSPLAGSLKQAFAASRLVIPSISVGNVPQLTVDLLIHNFGFQLVGRLDPVFTYPFASGADYVAGEEQTGKPGGYSTSLDIFHSEELKLTVLQQRSPVLPGYQVNFIKQLVQFVEEYDFNGVVVLDSTDCSTVANINFENPFDVYTNEKELVDKFQQLNIQTAASISEPQQTLQQDQQQDEQQISQFSSFVIKLVHSLNSSTNVLAITMYVYEGDNTNDAIAFLKKLSVLLPLPLPPINNQPSLKFPKSWDGLYGSRPLPSALEEGLFG